VRGVGVVVGWAGGVVAGSGRDAVVIDFVAGEVAGDVDHGVLCAVGTADDYFVAAAVVGDDVFDFVGFAGVAVWSGGGSEAVGARAGGGWEEGQGEGEGQAWWWRDRHDERSDGVDAAGD
jgi:hypothetical protein